MRNRLVAVLASWVLLAGGVHAQPPPARPAVDLARDAARHPAEVIAFAGVKPGDTVIEMMPGGGYFTRVLSAAVGPGGKVYAVVPSFLAERFPDGVTALKAMAASPGYGNVAVVVEGLGKLPRQGPADVVFTAQNYHDLHNPAVPPETAEKVDEAALAALKPGGLYVVEDHAAASGAGAGQAGTLHRIEPAFARAEVERAGFVFDGGSSILANPADPHTATVFDPAIRGRTDQFLFRFKKPR